MKSADTVRMATLPEIVNTSSPLYPRQPATGVVMVVDDNPANLKLMEGMLRPPGYPDGLREEEIPLSARILAVADCYDALRSTRCYKPAVSHEETRAIILESGGTHFDPAVTAVFRDLSEVFSEVRSDMDKTRGVSDGG